MDFDCEDHAETCFKLKPINETQTGVKKISLKTSRLGNLLFCSEIGDEDFNRFTRHRIYRMHAHADFLQLA